MKAYLGRLKAKTKQELIKESKNLRKKERKQSKTELTPYQRELIEKVIKKISITDGL